MVVIAILVALSALAGAFLLRAMAHERAALRWKRQAEFWQSNAEYWKGLLRAAPGQGRTAPGQKQDGRVKRGLVLAIAGFGVVLVTLPLPLEYAYVTALGVAAIVAGALLDDTEEPREEGWRGRQR